MNRYILILTLLSTIIIVGCKNSNPNNTEVTSEIINNPISASGNITNKNTPVIHFQKEIHDFGIIIQGEKVSHRFKFKNIGDSDLVVKNATASCGCTVPSFSKKPIAPGEEGEIEVIFDSANRSGRQTKTITVWSNTQPNQTKLVIECEIVIRK